jgi:hypothetical protein
MSGQKITFSSADIQGAPETFSEADIAARPVSQPAAPAPEQPGAVRRFLGGAAQMLLPSTTPSDYIKGPMYVARHPLDSLGLLAGAIKDAHAAQFQKAKTAGSEGRYSEMLGHGLATVVPVIGPAAATAGETIGQGDIAGGLGQTTGLLAPIVGPKAVAAIPGGQRVQAATTGLRARAADALQQGIARRVVDVAAPKVGPNKTRLGNQIAKVAPRLAREEGLGAMSRSGLQAKVESKLASAESALDEAGDARLSAATVETGPIVQALREKQQRLAVEPVEGSRRIPSVTSKAVIDEPVPQRFAEVGAKPSQIEASAYKDASRNGYQGSREQFRAEFKERVRMAKDLEREQSIIDGEYGSEALLTSIRKLGGLRPFTKEMGTGRKLRGDFASIVENFGAASTRGQRGGATIFRKNGLGLDDLLDQLRQDPRWSYLDEYSLTEKLDEISRGKTTSRTTDVEHYLSAAGVEPGKKWWIENTDFNPNNMDAPAPGAIDLKGRPLGQPVIPEPNRPRAEPIGQAISEIEQLGPYTRYEPLRRMREAYDQPAKARYAPSITSDFLKKQGESQGAADVTAVLRERLAQIDPATATANNDYHVFRTAADVLRAAEETDRVRPNVFRKTMGRVTGAATGTAAGGGVGAVAGILTADFIDAIARSGVTTKIHTARVMAQLEDALRGNRTSQVQSLLVQLQRIKDAALKTSVGAGQTQAASAR